MMMKIKKLILLVTGIPIFIALSTTINIQAAESNLPGGTSISVTIDQPVQGAEFSVTAVQNNTIHVSGTASLGVGTTNPDTSLIYILDASGSTEESAGVNAFCPDQNPGDVDPNDPVPDENEIIDCEIGAAIALNNQAIALGTVDEVAIIMFAGDAVTADTTPSTEFAPLTSPAADHNLNQVNDVDEMLHSIQVAFLFGHKSGFSEFNQRDTPDIIKTDYADALREAERIIAQTSNPNVIVMFVSDGANNAGTHINNVLPMNIPGKHVVFHTFVVPGTSSNGLNCDSDPNLLGSLRAIADIQNSLNNSQEGACYQVDNPADLPDLLPDIILPTLDMLEMSIDNSLPIQITPQNMTTQLPQNGPINVSYETAVSNLDVGEHHICITATGSDIGGQGSVSDCTTITITTTGQPMEFGDAPNSYPTSLANDGARHEDYSMEWLGLSVNGELDALAEDSSDDGLELAKSHYPNRRMYVTVTTSGLGAARYGPESERRLYLQIWIDYNQDGDWDDLGEDAVLCDIAPGTQGQCNGKATNWRHADQSSLRFPVVFRLRSTNQGPSWIRARLTYGTTVSPAGAAAFGEVEDYHEVIFQR